MLDLWQLDLADPRLAAVVAEAEDWLGEADRALLHKRTGAAARRFLLGRWLMRRALGAATGLPPQDLAFTLGTNGKPECAVAAARGIVCNLSHSGDRLVLAVARASAIGVDVEAAGRGTQALRVGRSFFPEVEQRLLSGLPEDRAEAMALRLWTVRESLSKAAGRTVWDGLKEVGLDPSGQRMALRGLAEAGDQKARAGWQAADGPLGGDCHLAVAVVDGGADCLRHALPLIDPLDRAQGGHWVPETIWQADA